MVSVFKYIDYRNFLADYYAEQKKRSRAFSYRWFSHRAGIKSPTLLKLIIDGKRSLTSPMAEKFADAMKLTDKQRLYFRHLVGFNRAKTAIEKQEHYAVLRELNNTVNRHVLNKDSYDFYKKWYTSVIRELVCIHDFRDDYAALGKAVAPAISAAEARRSVELLLRLGMIRKTDAGGYVQTNACITTGDEITSLAVRQFNKQMLRLALEAVEDFPRDQRHVSGITLGVSRATYDVLQEEIRAFKERIISLVSRDAKSDRVCQFGVQLFPVSDVLGHDRSREEA
jgi:uncharacterized protein (TIGR02147 family)